MSFRQVVPNSSSHHHPLFSSGLELADLVVSSDLLHLSWTAISALCEDFDSDSQDAVTDELTASSSTLLSRFSVRYRTQPAQNYTIIAFASSPPPSNQGREILIPSPSLEQNCSLFEFLYTKDNPSFSINQEAITLFISLFDQLSSLHNQLGDSNKPLIITGHSLGGSVASLFTLWLLENIPQSTKNLPFCITYGSPLIGDHGFQQAISDCQTWNHRFLHVVSDHDIIPRLFTSPPNSLLTFNLNPQTSSYKPFGTFLMCSQSGCACFEDPETVLELMAAIESKIGRTRNSSEGLQVVGIAHYGEVVEHLKSKIMYKDVSEFQGLSTSPRAEIVLQLEAIGLKNTEQQNSEYDDLIAAMENRERANYFSHRRRISDPGKKLNDIKINMAYLEWYKKVSKAVGMGYYDSYKSRRTPRDMDVVKYKNMLTNYWIDMVKETERKPQKQGLCFRIRWLYAGTNYRRMVEPLDIADYYKMPGKKDYQTQGRKHHYIMLQKWQEEVEQAAEDQNKAMTRNAASSLTEDSCFWAHVEDAIILCESLRNGEEASLGREGSSRKNLMEFESYVMDLIKKFAVSPEVFLEKSSFMQWWSGYKLTLDLEYSSPLTEFMKNHHYRQEASCKSADSQTTKGSTEPALLHVVFQQGVVSCSDILALAARDLVTMVGGPFYNVRLGRKDGFISQASRVEGNLPKSEMTVSELISYFQSKGFSAQEMVALSGAHTIGFSHCKEFANRIFNHSKKSPVDPDLNPKFVEGLKTVCGNYKTNQAMSAFNDVITPNKFDNMYYKNLERGLGLLNSDNVLIKDPRTKPFAELYAANQTAFFEAFAHAMEKVGVHEIKTGHKGEVRHRCDAFNSIKA